ncbi:MAG: transaldolase family protein [Spirochaetales bacterium]|nr:transaldolase family protein [Spirochaetales bacterium]
MKTSLFLTPQLSEQIRYFYNIWKDEGKIVSPDSSQWAAVSATGTRLWLDTGDIEQIEKLWNTHFEALTTNNTLLNMEIQKGIYDRVVPEIATVIRQNAPDIDKNNLILEISFFLNALHGLRLAHKFNAMVSVELHTDLADDHERSIAFGKALYSISPQRFIIKIPLTPEGLIAAKKLSGDGIPVNFTLGFSARQNYFAALFSNPAFLNVFMGRITSFVSSNNLGTGINTGEKATIAAQRELIKLREQGRSGSLLIGASMRKSEQIRDLAGLDVFTIPPAVAQEFQQNSFPEIKKRLNPDLPVELSGNNTFSGCYLASLWEIEESFKEATEVILRNPQITTGDQLIASFEKQGIKDLFPTVTPGEISHIKKDGKIPDFINWSSRLSGKEIGLDSLLNISALYSFKADQKALDQRIESLL